MATFTSIFLTVTILLAASSAAPQNQKLALKVPDECIGKDFCSIKPEGYDTIQELVKGLLTPMIIAQNLGNRIAETNKEELSPREDWHNCPFIRKTEEPLWAYSDSDKSAPDYVIQHDLYRQPIEHVTCATAHINVTSSQQCFGELGLEPLRMKTSCQATKAKRSLLVLDYKSHKLIQKSYNVSCCCSCQIIKS